MNNEEKLIELITQAIAYKYPNDATRPGLTISYLKNNRFYCSAVRHRVEGKTKVVVCKAFNSSLEGALKELSEKLLRDVRPKNPLDHLSEFVNKDKKVLYEPEDLKDSNDRVKFVPADFYEDDYDYDTGSWGID